VWFGILGPVEARRDDGEPVALGGPRVRALLAMLLLDAGRIVSTERLVDGLYHDPPARTANALQSQVSRLRQVLKPLGNELLEFHPAGYRLAVPEATVDVHEFERLRREDKPAEALALWRGAALADVGDVPFAPGQITRLRELWLTTTEERIEADLAAGRSAELLAELRTLIAGHPLRERLRAQLMRALLADGRQAEALAAYEEARRALADELGADPSEELSAPHLRVLRAGSRPAGPARGLPAQLTSFVGRSDELTRIGELLRTSRLVTLTGPGGAGKTRLTIEAAARTAPETEVCFAELALVSDATEIPTTIAAAVGLRESMLPRPLPQAEDQSKRLIATLAGRRLLLVLDNRPADAARLLGAAAVLRGRQAAGDPDVERITAAARSELGDRAFETARAETATLPSPDAARWVSAWSAFGA
jgi:DNA-binding SARP family transcriptional activator